MSTDRAKAICAAVEQLEDALIAEEQAVAEMRSASRRALEAQMTTRDARAALDRILTSPEET